MNTKNFRPLWMVVLTALFPMASFWPGASSAHAASPPGLISRWAGDGTALDSAGANHGVMQNGATFGAGVTGQAFSLDGLDDFMRVPFDVSLNFSATNPFTVMALVNPQRLGAYEAVVVKCPVNNEWDWGLYWYPNGRFVAGRHNQEAVQSTNPLAPGAWHHAAFTYDSGVWALYVDGVLHGTTNGIYVTQSAGALAIGRKGESVANANCFAGRIDEVQIFNRALSGAEISAVYDAITNLPPFISVQPQSSSAKEGEPATFTVNATGPAPLAYQWLFNGSNIVGALSPTLTISRAQLQDAGDYSVVVSNAAGVITSASATLTVWPASVFEWAVSRTSSFGPGSFVGGYFIMGMATDAAGNSYASGNGLNVSKSDSSGASAWMQNVGIPAAVATDATGNVFVSGAFASNTITLTNESFPGTKSLLAKLDSNGTILWAKATGPNSPNYNNVLTVTPTGEPVTALTQTGSVVVTKRDAQGHELWTRRSDGLAFVNGIAADAAGSIYIGGQFSGATNLQFGAAVLTGSGNFVVKYSSTGNVVWARAVSGSGGRVFALAATSAGESFVTGLIDATNMTWGGIVLTNGKPNDIFVAKLDATGAVVWAKSSGGSSSDVPHGIGVDAAGNCYVAGGFSATATFDWASVVSRGERDVFVVKYSSAGEVQWVRQAGGTSTDNALALAVNSAGDCFITGSRSPLAWFGNIAVTNGDRFVAKLIDSAPRITTQPHSASVVNGNAMSLTVGASGLPPFAYQWRKDGVVLPDATNATFHFQNFQSPHQGAYSVVVTNVFGAVTSSVASVQVLLSSTAGLLPQNVMLNSTFEQDVDLDGWPDFWNRGGTGLGGVAWDTNEFVSPAHSLHVWDNDPNNYWEWFSQPVPVQPGATYLVRFWRRYNIPQGQFRNTMGFRSSAGDIVGGPSFLVSGQHLAWEEFNARVVVPTNAASAWFTLTSGGALSASGDMWIDNLSLALEPSRATEIFPVVSMTNLWRFNETQNLDGIPWQAPGFDDSTWPAGVGLLYAETNALVTPRNTPLTMGRTTYYFRTSFVHTGDSSHVVLTLNFLVDDGAVFYLNGHELARVRLPASVPISYTNYATTFPSSGDAIAVETLTLSGDVVTNLVNGTNVLAVEVHQTSATSSDVVFGTALTVERMEMRPALRWGRDGTFFLTVEAETGRTYNIETSQDLQLWTPLGTVLPTETSIRIQPFFNPFEPSRYYRLRRD